MLFCVHGVMVNVWNFLADEWGNRKLKFNYSMNVGDSEQIREKGKSVPVVAIGDISMLLSYRSLGVFFFCFAQSKS